jgi:hypothetical protein
MKQANVLADKIRESKSLGLATKGVCVETQHGFDSGNFAEIGTKR